jgi:hypothetical protein
MICLSKKYVASILLLFAVFSGKGMMIPGSEGITDPRIRNDPRVAFFEDLRLNIGVVNSFYNLISIGAEHRKIKQPAIYDNAEKHALIFGRPHSTNKLSPDGKVELTSFRNYKAKGKCEGQSIRIKCADLINHLPKKKFKPDGLVSYGDYVTAIQQKHILIRESLNLLKINTTTADADFRNAVAQVIAVESLPKLPETITFAQFEPAMEQHWKFQALRAYYKTIYDGLNKASNHELIPVDKPVVNVNTKVEETPLKMDTLKKNPVNNNVDLAPKKESKLGPKTFYAIFGISTLATFVGLVGAAYRFSPPFQAMIAGLITRFKLS